MVLTGVNNDDVAASTPSVQFAIPTVTTDDPVYSEVQPEGGVFVAIGDDDGPVTLEFATATTRSTEDTGDGVAVLALSKAYGADIAVHLTITRGTATRGEDFTSEASFVHTIPAGIARHALKIPTLDDALLEGDETVTLRIDAATFTPAHVGQDADPRLSTTMAIRDDEDDDPATVTLAPAAGQATGAGGVYEVREEDGAFEFTVTLSHELNGPARLDVPLALSGGTATWGPDMAPFALKAGAGLNAGVSLDGADGATPTVVFESGARVATLLARPHDDNELETNEALVLAMGSQAAFDADPDSTVAAGPAAGSREYQILIYDDEFTVGFPSTTITVNEDGGTAYLPLQFSQPPRQDIEIWFQYTDLNTTPGEDYTRMHERADPITVPAGTRTSGNPACSNAYLNAEDCPVVLPIPLIADGEREGQELMRIAVHHARLPRGQIRTSADVIIHDSDSGVVIEALDSRVTEGTAARFRLTRGQAAATKLPVKLHIWETADTTPVPDYHNLYHHGNPPPAASNGHFVAAAQEGPRTVDIPANATSATFTVPTRRNTSAEGHDSRLVVRIELAGQTLEAGQDDYSTGWRNFIASVPVRDAEPAKVNFSAASYTVREATVTIQDDDAEVIASLASAYLTANDTPEGAEVPLSLRWDPHRLQAGKTYTFPITFGGTATRGSDYTLACAGVPGVACANLNSGDAVLTVTTDDLLIPGDTSVIDVLTLTAVEDGVDETVRETVTMKLNDNSRGGTLSGAIVDAPDSVSVEFATATLSVQEGSGPLEPVLKVTPAAARDITLTLLYTDETATIDVDTVSPLRPSRFRPALPVIRSR